MRCSDNVKRYVSRERDGRKYAVSWHEYDEDVKRWVYDFCIPCSLAGAHIALWFDSSLDTPFILDEIKPM